MNHFGVCARQHPPLLDGCLVHFRLVVLILPPARLIGTIHELVVIEATQPVSTEHILHLVVHEAVQDGQEHTVEEHEETVDHAVDEIEDPVLWLVMVHFKEMRHSQQGQ